jgi:hypothetical protein
MEDNSNRGLMNVQKARINNSESRDLKHFKISLALWDALTTILLRCREKDGRSSQDIPRSVQAVTAGRLLASK